jgi:hypothetical protein
LEIIPIFRIFLEISFVYIGEKRGYVKEDQKEGASLGGRSTFMSKKLLIGIILVLVLMVGGCVGYSGSYRFDPYYGYYNHYPYGYHDSPSGYHGYGHHGGWYHWL